MRSDDPQQGNTATNVRAHRINILKDCADSTGFVGIATLNKDTASRHPQLEHPKQANNAIDRPQTIPSDSTWSTSDTLQKHDDERLAARARTSTQTNETEAEEPPSSSTTGCRAPEVCGAHELIRHSSPVETKTSCRRTGDQEGESWEPKAQNSWPEAE